MMRKEEKGMPLRRDQFPTLSRAVGDPAMKLV
jgi:hypothetical protein